LRQLLPVVCFAPCTPPFHETVLFVGKVPQKKREIPTEVSVPLRYRKFYFSVTFRPTTLERENSAYMVCPFLKESTVSLCEATDNAYIQSEFELDKYCRTARHRMCPFYCMRHAGEMEKAQKQDRS
jgi:hypothetical protein